MPKTVGVRFGHAGALVQREEDSAVAKASLLRAAGVHVADARGDSVAGAGVGAGSGRN